MNGDLITGLGLMVAVFIITGFFAAAMYCWGKEAQLSNQTRLRSAVDWALMTRAGVGKWHSTANKEETRAAVLELKEAIREVSDEG